MIQFTPNTHTHERPAILLPTRHVADTTNLPQRDFQHRNPAMSASDLYLPIVIAFWRQSPSQAHAIGNQQNSDRPDRHSLAPLKRIAFGVAGIVCGLIVFTASFSNASFSNANSPKAIAQYQALPHQQEGKSSWFRVTLLNGDSLEGKIVTLTEEHLDLTVPEGSAAYKRVALENIVSIVAPDVVPASDAIGDATETKLAVFELLDGSKLRFTQWTGDSKQISGSLASDQPTLTFSSSELKSIRIQGTAVDQWKSDLTDAAKEGDAIVIQKNSKLDWLNGIIRSFDEQGVSFSFQDREVNVPMAKVAGLIFFHPTQQERKSGNSRLYDRWGQIFSVADWQFHIIDQQPILQITTPGLLRKSVPLSDIVKWDFANARFVYLSDRSVDNFQWEPLISFGSTQQNLQFWNRPRLNKDFLDQPLQLMLKDRSIKPAQDINHLIEDWLGASSPIENQTQLKTFEKGLAVRVGSIATYQLDEGYNRLTGMIGLAPPASDSTAAHVTITADQKVVWEATLDGQNNPSQTIDVALGNPSRLTLKVAYPANRTHCDSVHFCQMRLMK